MTMTMMEPTATASLPAAPPMPAPLPAIPVTEADQALASLAANPVQARTSTSFKEILAQRWPDQVAKAQNEGRDLFPKMLDNSALVSAYGLNALAGLNAVSDRLLKEFDDDITIPQLEAIMGDLLDGLDALKHNFDLNDPEVKKDFETYQKGKGFFAKLFRRGHNWLRKFHEDIMSLSQKVTKVDKQLGNERDGLNVRVARYDDVYKQAAAEIVPLVYAGAVLEYVHDITVEEAAKISTTGTDLADDQRELKSRIEDLGSQLEIKTNAFLTRLFVAYSTLPQVRMTRRTDQNLILQIDTIRGSTLYTMRLQMALFLGNAKSAIASKQAEAALNAANRVAQDYSASLGVTLPEAERRAQSSDLKPETILAMANGLAQAAHGIKQALQEGRQERQKVREAIVQAADIMGNAQQELDDAFLEEFVGSATRKADSLTV